MKYYKPHKVKKPEINSTANANNEFIFIRLLKILNITFMTISATVIVAMVISVLFSSLSYQLVVLSGVSVDWRELILDMIVFSFLMSCPAVLFFFPGFLKSHDFEKNS